MSQSIVFLRHATLHHEPSGAFKQSVYSNECTPDEELIKERIQEAIYELNEQYVFVRCTTKFLSEREIPMSTDQ